MIIFVVFSTRIRSRLFNMFKLNFPNITLRVPLPTHLFESKEIK
jgi:hypothetical protein